MVNLKFSHPEDHLGRLLSQGQRLWGGFRPGFSNPGINLFSHLARKMKHLKNFTEAHGGKSDRL